MSAAESGPIWKSEYSFISAFSDQLNVRYVSKVPILISFDSWSMSKTQFQRLGTTSLETCILRPQDVFLLITNDHVFRVFLPHNRKNGCLQLKIMLELKMRTILSVLRCIDFSSTNSRELQFVLRYGAESFGIRSRLFYLGSPQRCFVVHETPMIVCMFHSNKRTTTA